MSFFISNMNRPFHLLSVNDITIQYFYHICERAKSYKDNKPSPICLNDKIVSLVFYEPSTRTHSSFQAAAYKLGAKIIDLDIEKSSILKGETCEDTIMTMGCYTDVIVVRHPQSDCMIPLSNYSSVPIINAGDGNGEHPTQALLDCFTINEHYPYGGFHIAFVGDLKNGRAVHSTMLLLDKIYNGITFSFVANDNLFLDISYLSRLKNKYQIVNTLDEIIDKVNIIYMTRIQKEREGLNTTHTNILTSSLLGKTKSRTIVMHPFPRNEEIPSENDTNPKCIYVEQMKNGLYVRMAILESIFTRKN